jgi:hypothetical protein
VRQDALPARSDARDDGAVEQFALMMQFRQIDFLNGRHVS